MSLWRQLTRGVRVLTRRAAADEDVADEVRHYLEQATEAWSARGLSDDEARRAARLEVGNPAAIREQVRSYGWENLLSTVVADLRYAMRRLRGTPGLSLVAVTTLALGVGASTAIFSVVNPILLQPLPYPDAHRITAIWDHLSDGSRLDTTFGTYRELLERSRSFDALAVTKPWQPTITSRTEPERFDGQRVSAAYFRVLGVQPAIGRDFQDSDDRLNSPNVVILSDTLWRRRFGGDAAIVGRQVTLDGDTYSVIGVMPRGFENVLSPSADVWSPLQYDMSLSQAWGHHLRMVGRRRTGVALDSARTELGGIAASPLPEFPRPPWAAVRQGFLLMSLQDDVTRGVRPALLAVLGAVMLVLMIACVNVTNLLLARGAQRRGEFAMRAALGAARSRLVRQMLTESLLLACAGGALGLLIAQLGVSALIALSPPGLPRVNAIRLDAAVFACGVALTSLIGLGIGLLPALDVSRTDLHGRAQHSSQRAVGGHHRTRRALVVAEVALALVLLVGSGLLLRSLERLFAVTPGFDATDVLTMQVQTSGHRFDVDATTHQFFDEALEAVRRVPGVASAAFTSQLPLSGDYELYGVHFESAADGNRETGKGAFRYAVSPGYVETMRIPLRRGRTLDAHDVAGVPPAVLINESFAKRRFPGHDALGQRLRIGPESGPWASIVGIVSDVKQMSLALDETDAVYVTTTQAHFADRALWLVVRARGNAPALAAAIRDAIWSVDKDQPIVRLTTMDALLARSAAERRFALILFEAFGAVALVLAAMGIYGVLSGSVTERMREIGVRSALGASRGSIVALVLRQGMTLTALGMAIGLTGAIVGSQAIVTLLFGVTRLDPATYAGVVALLVGVSSMACWLPAWRAARVDPSITLRAE
jgi:putative ABC transport system permease protein